MVSEEQKLLYNRRAREKMLNDPEWAEKRREKNRKYSARPDVIAKKNAIAKHKRAEDPEWAERARLIEKKSRQRPGVSEAKRLYTKAWRAANLDRERSRHANNQAKRRARLKGASGESINRSLVYERDGGVCHICGKHVAPEKFHIDHLIPISRGGSHIYANVAVAHPNCNIRRGPGRLPAQLRLVG